MIPTIKTKQLLDEMGGTRNRPIKAICNSQNKMEIYYLKYARTGSEIDGLVSEILCQRLAKYLHINTPDIAIVEIGDHPIDPVKFTHSQHLNPGTIVFGSKELKEGVELTRHTFVMSKHDFNRLEHPNKILRIGLFDLWIGNVDRQEGNFNLFLTTSNQQKLYVIDHFEAFRDISSISGYNQQNIEPTVDPYQGFLGSNYAFKMLSWIEKRELQNELKKFIESVNSINITDFVSDIISDLPSTWRVSEKTICYIKRFLLSSERIESINSEVGNYIKYYLATK